MIVYQEKESRKLAFEQCLRRGFHKPYPDGYFERCSRCGSPTYVTTTMKYTKVKSSGNSWTCKCGNFYHRSTKYCRDCPLSWSDKLLHLILGHSWVEIDVFEFGFSDGASGFRYYKCFCGKKVRKHHAKIMQNTTPPL